MAGDTLLRTIVITGASSGLGGALARAYAAEGVTLGLVGRNRARLEETAAACRGRGAEVVLGLFDVGEAEPLGSWLQAFDHRTPIDILFANAGVSAGPAPGEAGEGLALAALQVRTNLMGVLNTVEPLLPRMAERGRGKIAVVSSIAAFRGLPYSPAYSASKAGVRAYGEALRARLRPHGVHVTVACPGFFDSPMTDRFTGSKSFVYSLERAARIIKRGVDNGRGRTAFPWLLVLALKLGDLAPPFIGDPIMRAFRFRIRPPTE